MHLILIALVGLLTVGASPWLPRAHGSAAPATGTAATAAAPHAVAPAPPPARMDGVIGGGPSDPVH